VLARPDDLEHGFQPPEVFVKGQAADFHLHHRVAGAEVAAHFILQILDRLPRPIPATAHVAEHLVWKFAAIESLGEQHAQRLVGNLGNGIPDRNLDGADRDGPFGMPSSFFPPHHAGENFRGIVVPATCVQKRGRVGGENARNEPCPHLRAAGVTAGRIECETADGLAVANDVGDHGDYRRRHFGKIEARIGERRLERDRGFADIDDTHSATSTKVH
jgi:hypothetical protein